ncbi:MAG: hypothetical protein Q8T08_04680 [Ignavibacteria bacterium]|nr:hypothetical protein [Ignavibacteria bacterium]
MKKDIFIKEQNETDVCPMCHQLGISFFHNRKRHYFQCTSCEGIFLQKKYWLSSFDEKDRYQRHNNDVNNIGYQTYLMPVVDAIITDYQSNSKGLDFGAGPGPVVANILEKSGFSIALYDPFFHPNTEALEPRLRNR